MAGLRLLIRRADDQNGQWRVLETNGQIKLALPDQDVEPGVTYIIRPMHGRLNFDSTQVTFNPPVDLFQTVQINPLGQVPAAVAIQNGGQTDPRLAIDVDTSSATPAVKKSV